MQSLKHIARICLVGVLLLGASGVSLVIHHEHEHPLPSGDSTEPTGDHHSGDHHSGDKHQGNTSTYHETHIVKLCSDDHFTTSTATGLRAPITLSSPCIVGPTELNLNIVGATALHAAMRVFHPPSVDNYILFRSILV